MGKVIAMDAPEWAKELARHIFAAETKAKGRMMEGGYGFLSPKLKAAYETLAVRTVECSQKLPLADECVCKRLVCTYDHDFGCGLPQYPDGQNG